VKEQELRAEAHLPFINVAKPDEKQRVQQTLSMTQCSDVEHKIITRTSYIKTNTGFMCNKSAIFLHDFQTSLPNSQNYKYARIGGEIRHWFHTHDTRVS
jgi:hypothetical protein